jgi:putative ABC transport system permease protein
MLASGFWQQRKGGDTHVLGSTLTLDGEPYTVIGVLPPMVGLGSVDLWVPVGLSANDPSFTRPNHPGLIGVGRLRRGATIGQMNQDLSRISREIAAEHPRESAGIGAEGDSFRELLVHNIRPVLSLLTWAVLCVLLIACVNVANLLLARSTSRRKEIALRLALGASDGRIRRLLLSEHLLVAALGGALGVALAYGAVRAVVQTRPAGVPRLADIHIDLAVLAFAAVVSLLTGLVFGLLPARSATRVDLIDPLKESGRSSASGATLRLRGALMTGEVALALMLLIGAGLLIRSVSHLTQVNPGVDPRGITTGWIFLPESKYSNADRQRLALQEILQRVQTVPGVTSAALTSAFPLASNSQVGVTFEGHPKPIGQQPLVNIQLISREYFNTVRMRVIRGRGFTGTDIKGDDDAVWIDETVAKKYFPDEDPVGRRIVRGPFDSKERPWIVAGVVNDVLDQGLGERARGTLYRPFEPEPQTWMGLVVKTAMPFEQILPAVRRGIASVDPALPLASEETLDHMIAQSIGQETFTMYVLVGFAMVALVLAAVGVYGVIAYFVAQRSREIGIRMALGAQRSDIVSMVSRRVMLTAGVGITVGLVGAAAASGLMSTLIYEVAPIDPVTYAAGALALLAVAASAAVVPTLRATRVNPASAMRAE